MALLEKRPVVFRFGAFEVNLRAKEVRKYGTQVRLPCQPFEILAILLEQAGDVVLREELHQRLWSADTYVDFEHGLNNAVKKLRAALGDSAECPLYVETLARVGYRFIAPVEEVCEAPAAQVTSQRKHQEDTISAEPPASRRIARLPVAVWIVLILFLTVLAVISWPRPSPNVKRILQITHDGAICRSHPLVTDGPRLYFHEGLEYAGMFKQMPVSGGDSFPVSMPRPGARVEDLYPETSELLAIDQTLDVGELWVVSLLGNFARRTSEIKANTAAWSPDGSRVAFANKLDLYVVNRDGEGPQKLVTLPAEASCLRWSPDGTKLRFEVDDPKPQPSSLWEVSSNGRDLHPVFPNWHGATHAGCGNWSPNGRYFFFEANRQGARDIWAVRERRGLLELKTPQPIQLTSGPLDFYFPTPSRDGQHLFVVGEQRRGELIRYDEKTRQFVPFLNGISANDVEFSHDGKWIAYATYPDRTLWKSRIDGSERLQLTASPMRAFLPRWSPDDRRILFHGIEEADRPWKLYVMSASGGAPETLIPDHDSQEADGTWSPDGKSIVYGHGKISSYPSPGAFEIRLLDMKTKQGTAVPGSQGLYGPRWSPDGRLVAALVAGTDHLMLYDVTTQKWRQLFPEGVGYHSWSRDGQYIYCNTLWRKNPSLVRVTVATGRIEFIPVSFAAAGTFGAWSGATPDGSFLLLRDLGSRDIYSLDLDLP